MFTLIAGSETRLDQRYQEEEARDRHRGIVVSPVSSSHRATDTLLTINFLGYERINHAPYSPDLAPMDFAVFPRLKDELRGRTL